MKNLYLLNVFMLATFVCYSQQPWKISYHQLKEYEGLYEYLNNATLKIAVSPKDTVTYAIINDTRYHLSPAGKDLFEDMTKTKVQFFRDKKNEIAGYYYAGKDTCKLLSKKVDFPKSMWYPRPDVPKDYKYWYKQPTNDNDGLETGSLKNTGLDIVLLNEMMQKIIDGT